MTPVLDVERTLGARPRRLEARALPGAPRARVAYAPLERAPLEVLEIAPEELAERARRDDDAACLHAAWSAAVAPPPPLSIMGVVNVTPDSFSDGGDFLDPGRAVAHGLALVAAGADRLDVGGESTRPGAEPVDAATERERVLPVVAGLAAATDVPIAIDTSRASVAAAALDAGASIVNDVTAGRRDEAMLAVAAGRDARLILMHMQGEPRTMQSAPRYDDVVREVLAHLRERAAAAWMAGVDPSRIEIDPGIGFGKRLEDNLALVRAVPELRSLGLPVCIGVSRKSFLGRLTGVEPARARLPETAAAVAACAAGGAATLRVHDVDEMSRAARVARAIAFGADA